MIKSWWSDFFFVSWKKSNIRKCRGSIKIRKVLWLFLETCHIYDFRILRKCNDCPRNQNHILDVYFHFNKVDIWVIKIWWRGFLRLFVWSWKSIKFYCKFSNPKNVINQNKHDFFTFIYYLSRVWGLRWSFFLQPSLDYFGNR